jgi:hypothetical protein
MNLPRETVFLPEVERILQDRLGFFRARNRSDLATVRANWEDVLEWNPLQKVYLCKDEESAAEDMTFILYDVWKLPLDWPLYIKAASLAGGIGIQSCGVANFALDKAASAFAGTAKKVSRMRTQRRAGQAVSNAFTDEERKEME